MNRNIVSLLNEVMLLTEKQVLIENNIDYLDYIEQCDEIENIDEIEQIIFYSTLNRQAELILDFNLFLEFESMREKYKKEIDCFTDYEMLLDTVYETQTNRENECE